MKLINKQLDDLHSQVEWMLRLHYNGVRLEAKDLAVLLSLLSLYKKELESNFNSNLLIDIIKTKLKTGGVLSNIEIRMYRHAIEWGKDCLCIISKQIQDIANSAIQYYLNSLKLETNSTLKRQTK